LSVAVAKLEKELGVALFDRTRRQIALTATGEVFLEHAREVIHDIDSREKTVELISAEIKAAKLEPRVIAKAAEVGLLGLLGVVVGEAVDPDNRGAVVQKALDEPRADEPRTAGYERPAVRRVEVLGSRNPQFVTAKYS